MTNSNRTPSGFPMLDLLTGGYPTGSIVAARYLGNELQAEIVQAYMERQAIAFALSNGKPGMKTLLVTLQMTENETARSLFMGKYVPTETLVQASLHISALDERKKVPDPGVFLSELEDNIRKLRPQALIIDAIDNLIPKDDPATREAVSEMLLSALFAIIERNPVPVIVTDYENRWEATGYREPRIVDIELNEDAYGTVQAAIHEGERKTVIENLFGVPESPGLEIVRAIIRSEGYLPPAGLKDEVPILAGAAAIAIRHIDKLLKPTDHD